MNPRLDTDMVIKGHQRDTLNRLNYVDDLDYLSDHVQRDA